MGKEKLVYFGINPLEPRAELLKSICIVHVSYLANIEEVVYVT